MFSYKAIAQGYNCGTMAHLSKQIAKNPGLGAAKEKQIIVLNSVR